MAKNQQQSDQEAQREKAQKKIDAFKKGATGATRRAMAALDKVLVFTNRKSYTSDKAQQDKIVNALQSRLDRIKKAFETGQGAGAELEL